MLEAVLLLGFKCLIDDDEGTEDLYEGKADAEDLE
jgi:hypothetical protein